MTSPDELLAVGVRVVRTAAETARTLRTRAILDVDTKSSATDVVTAADREVERLAIDTLAQLRPGDPVLSEESGSTGETGAGAVRWVLDPIDGTVNYLYGLPPYAVSLAAEVDGVVVAGVVREIASGREWTATRGGGAYADGRRLAASTATDLGQALVATGFGYAAERRAHQARVVAEVLPRVRDIRRLGAASVDLCHAAEARVDAYFEKGLNLWDHAAGGLIAAEAGLRVSGLSGAAPSPDFVLAAPDGLYEALHTLLVELDAAGGP